MLSENKCIYQYKNKLGISLLKIAQKNLKLKISWKCLANYLF